MTELLGSLAERSVSGAATLACELDLRGAAPGPGGRYGRRGGGAADRRREPRWHRRRRAASRQNPTNTTRGDIGVVAGRWLVTLGGFACARNRSCPFPTRRSSDLAPA